jgi:solute carrier family 13 (sodium-dependent dicarboxylate transporter), member 2/3/5
MTRQTIGFALALCLFILCLMLPTLDSFLRTATQIIAEQHTQIDPAELARSMQTVLALSLLMIVLWLTEAIPLPATALLPAALLPLMHLRGVAHGTTVEFNFTNIVANYANPVIYLFLGGFLIAAAMQKWKLDSRLTLWLLTRGNLAADSRKILLGMMSVTAFLSMWISNTATAAMMLPLGIGVLSSMGCKPGTSRFGTALMLGIAWSASIGGMGTIIGTPPNGIALGILNASFAGDPSYHRITFLEWMLFGIPYVVLFVPVAWLVLLKLFPPEMAKEAGAKSRLMQEYSTLGSLSRGENRTIVMFFFVSFLWIVTPFREQLLPYAISERLAWLDEYAIGLFVGTLLFFVPVNFKRGEFLLNWSDVKSIDWGTLILFGGGIALSDAMFKSGFAVWVAHTFIAGVGSPSTLVMMFAIVLLVDFLTEVTSNTAVTTIMVPIVISVAKVTGESPITLAIACALAASMAFMLPVATPPNALVYSTGYIKLKDMVKAGFVLDILGWLFTVGIIVVFGVWMFGVLGL